MKKINLGCGDDYKEGFLNVDFYAKCDMKVDLNILPLPFKDNEFDYLLCKQTLEHLDCNELEFVKECFRIVKDGGFLRFEVPSMSPMLYHKRWYHPISYFNPVEELSGNKDFCQINAKIINRKQDFDFKHFFHRLYEIIRAMGSFDLIVEMKK